MPSFIIGMVEMNDKGFEEYRFSSNPYVHRSEDAAIQQARYLARQMDGEFAVFRKVASVEVESGEDSN